MLSLLICEAQKNHPLIKVCRIHQPRSFLSINGAKLYFFTWQFEGQTAKFVYSSNTGNATKDMCET